MAEKEVTAGPGWRVFAGLFVITLSTLTFEIVLTRIFSVTLWYHFAFMVVSVAMFGLAGGALLVQLFPRLFVSQRAAEQMGLASVAFAVTALASVVLHISLPLQGPFALLLTYLVLVLPFLCSGIAVCLGLTKFPEHVSPLYAADLIGAALGCLAVFGLLELVDGVSAVFFVAFAGSVGGFILIPRSSGIQRRVTVTIAVVVGLLGCVNAAAFENGWPHLGVRWTKLGLENEPLHEAWNHFSRIGVYDDAPTHPTGWGLSEACRTDQEIRQLWLRIDGLAGTLLTEFEGSFSELEYLRCDISNLAHYVRPDGGVFVIGAGGGRDVLSARLFGHERIVAAELNENILETVTSHFGDFTGHLDRLRGVRFVHDEARAYLAASGDRYEVIQASWIDTWAATTAGAFVLTENSLYTVESWQTFLDHLTPTGILTMTREYDSQSPRHAARLLGLGRAALQGMEFEAPEDHLILVVNETSAPAGGPVRGNSTILVGRQPFSPAEVDSIRRVVERLDFELAWAPGMNPAEHRWGELFRSLATGRGLDELQSRWDFRLDPPTLDNPFFFNMVSVESLLEPSFWREHGDDMNLRAVGNLVILQIVVLGLALVCLVLPLGWTGRTPSIRGHWPWLLFFSAIGLGFMLVEVSQIQRLSVFLGHPTYGLAVVLFSLLLGSGFGSWWTDRVQPFRVRVRGSILLTLLGAVVCAVGLLTPMVIDRFETAPLAVRITLSTGLTVVLGFVMGMPFPLGIKAALHRADTEALTPWFWAMNGAMSVSASVLAVLVSVEQGISASYWLGFWAYTISIVSFLIAAERDAIRESVLTPAPSETG